METKKAFWCKSGRFFGGAAALVAASLFVGGSVKAYADDGYNMAPPVDAVNIPSDTSNVFQWSEVPQNQEVPLTRAVFDKSGYQLYDTAGETILVPFKDNNLYVMKFAVSPDGTTYFINDGTCPTIYLPRDGFLVNQAADGAQWYPFTDGFAPTQPVFLGCAQSWDDFCNIAWYPGMVLYGGYWCDSPHFSFDALIPCNGFFISIGINNFPSWDGYWGFVHRHPDFVHVGYLPRDFRGFDGHHDRDVAFQGGDFPGGFSHNRGFGFNGNGREFRGVEGFHHDAGSDNHSDNHFDNRGGNAHPVDGQGGGFDHRFRGGDVNGGDPHQFDNRGSDNHNFGGNNNPRQFDNHNSGGNNDPHQFDNRNFGGNNDPHQFTNHGFNGNRGDQGPDSFGHGGFNGSHGNSGTSTTPPAPPSLGGSHSWSNSGFHGWSGGNNDNRNTGSSSSSGWSHNSGGDNGNHNTGNSSSGGWSRNSGGDSGHQSGNSSNGGWGHH